MAGGETSGSAIASITYFLLKNPDAHRKLKEEVRLAYVSYEDIDVASTTKLEYLMAVLKEGMRIFPTAPQGTPRRSPGMNVGSHYVPQGVSYLTMRRNKVSIVDDHLGGVLRLSLGCYPRPAFLERALCI
jgi:cytochrome P450